MLPFKHGSDKHSITICTESELNLCILVQYSRPPAILHRGSEPSLPPLIKNTTRLLTPLSGSSGTTSGHSSRNNKPYERRRRSAENLLISVGNEGCLDHQNTRRNSSEGDYKPGLNAVLNSEKYTNNNRYHGVTAWEAGDEKKEEDISSDGVDGTALKEELLLKQIAEVEERLQKNQNLREWIVSKDEKRKTSFLEREISLAKIQEASRLREEKRLERVRGIKEKVEERRRSLRGEAEAAQASQVSISKNTNKLY